jgi:hypothetical protein
MSQRTLLLIDAIINLVVGFLLGVFPRELIEMLGIPLVERPFYASVLGGVLFGIGVALLLERSRGKICLGGLGLCGAIAINLCGGIVLACWLLFGELDVPIRGQVIMWCFAGILFAISALELVGRRKETAEDSQG